ncbi:M23 family metallopeptidase [bacterium]|nr:M23 family metallopeptidase [bacterium]
MTENDKNSGALLEEQDPFVIDINHGDEIIAVDIEIGSKTHLIDLMLNALVITYTGEMPVFLKRIHFTFMENGNPLYEAVLKEKLLKDEIDGLFAYINDNKTNKNHLVTVFGSDSFFPKNKLTSETDMEANQSVGIMNQHFSFQSGCAADTLEISVFAKSLDEKFLYSSKRFSIIKYENKQKLLFPLRGTWLVCNNFDYFLAHRRCWSQEFAIDLIQIKSGGKMFSNIEAECNEDWVCYGQKVLAPADGVVVDIVDAVPENPGGLCSRLSREEWKDVYKNRGYKAAIAGNYIVLDHENGEFSFLAHLMPESLTVDLNERVKKGQVIARIGNSGNSDAAHLHYQLMDGPDFLKAKGLPILFENLTDISGAEIPFIYPNNSIVTTRT